ncbi:hypothetical protein MMC12_007299 [Toensbergia leucococca]|nr:hypothetical protein [Toensbergia leucococca]
MILPLCCLLACFFLLIDASPSPLIALSTSTPTYQNATSTSTYDTIVAGVTAPPNQCSPCALVVASNPLTFDPDPWNCTAAIIYETLFTGNGTSYTSASTKYMNTSTCSMGVYGEEGGATLLSDGSGIIWEGYTLSYNQGYNLIGGFDVLFNTWTTVGPSSSCATPTSGIDDPDFTYFPYLGITNDIYVYQDAPFTSQPATDTTPEPDPPLSTFLSLLDASSCEVVPDGEPTSLQAVKVLTVTSSTTLPAPTDRKTVNPFTSKAKADTPSPSPLPSPSTSISTTNLPSTISIITSPAPVALVPVSPIPTPGAPEVLASVSSTLTSTTGPATTISSLQPVHASSSYNALLPSSAANPQEIPNPESATVLISALLASTTPTQIGTTYVASNNPPISSESASGSEANDAILDSIQSSFGQVTSGAAPAGGIIATEGPSAGIVGSSVIVADSASQFIVGSSTLVPGAPAVNVGGTILSIAPLVASPPIGSESNAPATANLLILSSQISGSANGQPVSSTPALLLPPLTIAGSTITPNAASQYLVGSQTLIPGAAAITVSGSVVSLAPSASALVVDGSTQAVLPTGQLSPILTIANSAVTPNAAGQYVVESQTLNPGSAITVSGNTISLAPSASAVIINGVTSAINVIPTSPAILTIGGAAITPNLAGQYIVGGQTLSPGGSAITVFSTTISLAPSASAIVFNGITSLVSSTPILLPPITLAGSTITPNAAGQYIVGSQTLTPGSAITISGTVVSLAPGASDVVVGSSTEALPTSSGGLAGLIYSGLGGLPTSSSSAAANVTEFTGAAPIGAISWWLGLGALVIWV